MQLCVLCDLEYDYLLLNKKKIKKNILWMIWLKIILIESKKAKV